MAQPQQSKSVKESFQKDLVVDSMRSGNSNNSSQSSQQAA